MSSTGVSWTLQAGSSGWIGRSGHTGVVVGSNIIIMGGMGFNPSNTGEFLYLSVLSIIFNASNVSKLFFLKIFV